MYHDYDVFNVAINYGKIVMQIGAKGGPAGVLAGSVAAAVVIVGVSIGYGAYQGVRKKCYGC